MFCWSLYVKAWRRCREHDKTQRSHDITESITFQQSSGRIMVMYMHGGLQRDIQSVADKKML
eukprot:scaffold62442_cov31-Prasinocladus_malaysianus.AAC.1